MIRISYTGNKFKIFKGSIINLSEGRLYQEQETETDEETGEELTTITKEKSSAYTIWKLTYNQKFKITDKVECQVQLGVNNIFDYTDKKDLAVIDPGRRFLAGAKFIF